MAIALIYLRVSTEDQAEHGYSIAAQREECLAKAHELGACSTAEFVDEGVSGSILERPALVAALERLRAGDVKWFICLDTSRLSRSVAHQLLLVDEIQKAGAELVFVNERFSDTPEGRFHLTVLAAVDEYERARTRLRSLIGKRAKAKAGRLTHSPGLYGYRFDKETDTLNLDEREAAVVQLIFGWFTSEDTSPGGIALRLNSMGIPSPRGKAWSRQTVRRILANTAYVGTLYIHRYDARDVKLNKYRPIDQKVKRTERPREEWVPISVPPLVDKTTWASAQARFATARRRRHAQGEHRYLLSGLLRCGRCGATMHGNLITSNGKKRAYYVCTAKSPGKPGQPRCRSKHVPSEELDRAVWQALTRPLISWLSERLQNPRTFFGELPDLLQDGRTEVLLAELKAVQDELAGLSDERSRVATMFQKRLIPERDMEERLAAIKKREDYLTRRHTELTAEFGQAQRAIDSQIHLRELIRSLERLCSAEPEELSGIMPFGDRRSLVRLLAESVIVDDGTVEVRAKITGTFRRS